MINIKLDELLEEKNMTILQLSDETGISRSTLNTMVNGNTKGIQFTTADTLCNYFKCDIGDLLEFTPTVDMPKLKSISIGQGKYSQYFILFLYSFSTRYGEEYTGLRMRIVLNSEEKSINLYMNRADAREIHEAKTGKKTFDSIPRGRKEVNSIKKEILEMLLPKNDTERVKSVFYHYNKALEYSSELQETVNQSMIGGSFTISYREKSTIDKYIKVPYIVYQIADDILITNKSILEEIEKDKNLYIEDKVQYFFAIYTCEKEDGSNISIDADNEKIDVSFYPVFSHADPRDVEYKKIKEF